MNTNNDQYVDPTDDTLDQAIHAVMMQAPPEGMKNRALQRAAAFDGSSIHNRPVVVQRFFLRNVWLGGACSAAVIFLIAYVFSSHSSGVAWSQVLEAVRETPWIHMKATSRDGRARETWLSFPQAIGVLRDQEMLRYDDYRSGNRYQYDVARKTLFHLTTGPAENFKSEESIFRAICEGNFSFPQARIVRQRQWAVTEDDRRWTMYELELQPQSDGPSPGEAKPLSMVVRVDSEKKLPDRMTTTQGKQKLEIDFDYPTEGPADIYALGTPRDATIEDQRPEAELDRILRIVQQNRHDFGDYVAVASGNRPIVHVIRCKGDKFRIDVGAADARRVTSGDEMEHWWQEFGSEVLLEGRVVCNGKNVSTRSAAKSDAGWKELSQSIQPGDARAVADGINEASQYLVELLAYPPNLDAQYLTTSPSHTVRLDRQGTNGPAGSVRIEWRRANLDRPGNKHAFQKEEFWLQPDYNYAVVKHVLSDCPALDEDPSQKQKQVVYEYDGFRQSPRGVWYPTVLRHKNALESEDKSAPDERRDKVTCFHLDFTAESPDAIFNSGWKGDLLTGIRVAQPVVKSGGELWTIRPPGGVPLLASRTEITVEGLERVRQRLESAPQKELDQWAEEIVRINGKEFESWEERQGCRTEVAVRLSVAFDGLRWNAGRAGKLLERVRSLSAAEVKIWSESLEELLKEQISRSQDVVFVLVPVDVLFDGQKYNADRAAKYRSRLKQLTDDDVVLWKTKVDQCGGTRLDAAINLMLLDDYYVQEVFQRPKFEAAARKGSWDQPPH